MFLHSPAAGGSTSACWQQEIANFLEANVDDVRTEAKQCIMDFAEDSGQDPPISKWKWNVFIAYTVEKIQMFET